VTTFDEIMDMAARIEKEADKLGETGHPKSPLSIMRKSRMDLVRDLRNAAAKYAHTEAQARA